MLKNLGKYISINITQISKHLFFLTLNNFFIFRNDLTCTLCVTIIQDLENWLTSETTEDEVYEDIILK